MWLSGPTGYTPWSADHPPLLQLARLQAEPVQRLEPLTILGRHSLEEVLPRPFDCAVDVHGLRIGRAALAKGGNVAYHATSLVGNHGVKGFYTCLF